MSELIFSSHRSSTGDFERVLLVHQAAKSTIADLGELQGLAEAAGGTVCGELLSRRSVPVVSTFLGKGKISELASMVDEEEISLVVVDQELSPIQERNLERELHCRVIDRTRLILDIFALRASTAEGKLQVELAQLRHMSTRLVRGWTHLERQKGGIGLRGPGETQLESDRRMLGHRIRTLRQRLEKVESQRKLRRRGRDRTPVPTVSLVGYTNAGKSTLFNTLTGADVYARDKLFATLDPTMRRYRPGEADEIVLSDTVGFISRLPHNLIKAFHSTLEEVRGSTLLIHVIDASDPEFRERKTEVENVLEEIGAAEIPRIEVMNKIDLVDEPARFQPGSDGRIDRVWLSATTSAGLEHLDRVLEMFFTRHLTHRWLRLPPQAGRIRAQIYTRCRIVSEKCHDQGDIELEVDISSAAEGWLESQSDFRSEYWIDKETSSDQPYSK